MINPENIIIFDAEIIRAIAIKPEQREQYDEQGIEYVTSWDAHDQMGIACLCAPTMAQCLSANSGAELYREAIFFTEQTIGNAEYYFNQFALLVSYNGLSFDVPLLRANGCFLDDARHYDLCDTFKRASGKRASMDNLAGANDLPRKTGHGANAPVMWQRGQRREVVEYCFSDCIVLAHLFARVLETGQLQNPHTGAMVKIEGPGKGLF